jgi:hypothetical protein
MWELKAERWVSAGVSVNSEMPDVRANSNPETSPTGVCLCWHAA